ncbi:uncharacterized protein LOC127102242 [Lathyrus oleraceus]|uniref:uncharacterized protein LOC127102242 n=1 Tax=Pisum sativum TaxID=3888 RepID=UPI0021D2A859|nr:uncharacterized protein LOC127102242 [Pisum sativum]
MDFGRRRTEKYTFKSPKIKDLRELGDLVADPIGFKDRYGILMSLLKNNMTNGILATLVQFHGQLYHCFTFPDYQLMSTLEEYSYLLGLHIYDQIPFSGLEEIPKDKVISEATHLKMSDIKAYMTTKGGILGLPAKFMMDKARYFASMKSIDAFKAILALLIYGLFLFYNVDINAIKIFLIGNTVPSLVADTYHSVHLRNSYSGGMVIFYVPLLYKWLISHLPRSTAFWNLRDGLLWSQKIMSLTYSDIEWYSHAYDEVKIIENCGEFPNVPLLDTKRGINYNPILAHRQLGYPMKDKPSNILLEVLFFKEGEDNKSLK